METRSGRLDFTPHSAPHTVALRLGFDRPVLSVAIALAGYECALWRLGPSRPAADRRSPGGGRRTGRRRLGGARHRHALPSRRQQRFLLRLDRLPPLRRARCARRACRTSSARCATRCWKARGRGEHAVPHALCRQPRARLPARDDARRAVHVPPAGAARPLRAPGFRRWLPRWRPPPRRCRRRAARRLDPCSPPPPRAWCASASPGATTAPASAPPGARPSSRGCW